jgi:hypothetical protein
MTEDATPIDAGESSPAQEDGWPKLVEIRTLVCYSVVIYADSKSQALEHVGGWEHTWDRSADLCYVCDVDVVDIRSGTPEEAHEVTANGQNKKHRELMKGTEISFDEWWDEFRRYAGEIDCPLGDQDEYIEYWRDGFTPWDAMREEIIDS